MVVVELLQFLLGDVHSGADFFGDDLLRNNLVLQVLLEILKRNALPHGGLFQVFHGFQLHLLTHFIEPLDDFGVGGDAQILALIKQQLLVDKIAENIFVSFRNDLVRVGGILLLRFLFQLIFAAHVFGAGNDLVVYAGYNFLDHCVGGQHRRQSGKTNQQQVGKCFSHSIEALRPAMIHKIRGYGQSKLYLRRRTPGHCVACYYDWFLSKRIRP